MITSIEIRPGEPKHRAYLKGLVGDIDLMVDCDVLSLHFKAIMGTNSTHKEISNIPLHEVSGKNIMRALNVLQNILKTDVSYILISNSALKYIIADSEFSREWNPELKLEEIQRGVFGSIGDIILLTDAYVHPQLSFAKNGVTFFSNS